MLWMPERVVGIFGHGVSLNVVGEAGQEHLPSDHVRQIGRGCSGSHEGDALGLEQGRRGQREGGIAVTDAGDQAFHGDGALGAGGGLLQVIFRVDRGELDHPPAEQAAGVIDLLCHQLGTVERGPIDRGEATGTEVVERHDLDRIGRLGVGHGGEHADGGDRRHQSRQDRLHNHTSLWRFDPDWVDCRPGSFPIQARRSGSAIPKRPFGR